MEPRICALCDSQAVVFCPSDDAFLCWACDARVHQANFLVARHFRHPLNNPDAHAGSCDDSELDSLSSSNNSLEKNPSYVTHVTSADSSHALSEVSRHRTNRSMGCMKMEDVLADWNAKLGLSSGEMAVRVACRTLKACLDRWKTAFPLRVCLAVSMWFGLRAAGRVNLQGESSAITSGKALKRLEEISGVPAKLILVAESRLGLAFRSRKQRLRRRVELEEGWAEC